MIGAGVKGATSIRERRGGEWGRGRKKGPKRMWK